MNLAHAPAFLDELMKQLAEKRIDISDWEIDHICYRTSSIENYERAKESASLVGDLLIESLINGRDIATYRLREPIHYQHWNIELLEIPAPKAGKITADGFEHIEVVIDQSFESLIQRYSWLNFSLKAINKRINPDIELELKGMAIKFHHQSLAAVIELEKNLP